MSATIADLLAKQNDKTYVWKVCHTWHITAGRMHFLSIVSGQSPSPEPDTKPRMSNQFGTRRCLQSRASLNRCHGAIMIRNSFITGLLSQLHRIGENPSLQVYRHTTATGWQFSEHVANNTALGMDLEIGNPQREPIQISRQKVRLWRFAGKYSTF